MRLNLRRLAPVSDQISKHPLITLAIVGAILYLVLIFGGGVFTGIRYAFQNRTVDKLEQKAATSDEKSKSLVNQADAQQLDRHAEDQNRERNIKPDLEKASRAVDATRQRTAAARREYEKARNTRDDRDPNLRDLHDRNCSNLRELFPREDLEFCKH